MSGAQQGAWDVVHEEDDGPDAREHATSAMGAARHAAESESKARGHAEAAGKHADRLSEVEQMVAEVRELAADVSATVRSLDTVAKTVAMLAEAMHTTHKESMGRIGDAIEAMGKPRRIVRDDSGRASGIQTE